MAGAFACLGLALLPALAAAQPTITTPSLSAVARQQFSAPITYSLTGTGFSVGNTTVIVDGTPRATTVLSANSLQFRLGWDDLGTAGTFPVLVRNVAPAPVVGDSAAINLTVTDPPAPTLLSSSPSSATAGGAQFTVNVSGTGFTRDTQLRWNGQARVTSVSGTTSAQMVVLASDIASAASSPAEISAFTPSPGGGTSGDLSFTINAAPVPATPAITSLSPNTLPVNGLGFTLVVNGSNFAPTSVVKWGASAKATTYLSATQLQASIPESDLAVPPGTVVVTVETPGAAGPSAPSNFTLTALGTPTLTVLSPSSLLARTGQTTLNATGSNFWRNSVLLWNGAPRQTVYNGTTSLTALLETSDTAAAGTAVVTVSTPGASPDTTGPLQIGIFDPPAPVITSFSPTTLQQNVTNTFNVFGSSFSTGSVVRVNGVDRPTQFNNSGNLTADLSPGDVSALGPLQVTVFTPAPGGGESAAEPIAVVPANPRPVLSRLSPNEVPVGAAAFTMTLTSDSSNFRQDSIVRVDGADRPTTYGSSAQLTAQIPASDLAAAGTKAVTVFTPSAIAESDAVQLTVGNALTPVLTTLQCAQAGNCPQVTARGGNLYNASPVDLVAIGRNFTSQSTILVNGGARPTTFNSATQITASLSQADIAASGLLAVKVMTPSAPADSNTINLPVTDPGPPALTSLSPDSTAAGATSAVTLTVNGGGFVRDSAIEWNGVALPTAFLSSRQLSTLLPASELRTAGTALVRVNTPGPGGGLSPQVTFAILAPSTPLITRLSPTQAVAGSVAFTLQVIGANFTAASVVNWNGSPLPTTYVNTTRVDAQVPSAGIATAGSANVTVTTAGAPAASNAMALSIVAAGTPAITLLQPESMRTGTPGATLTLLGSNFTAYSVARFNGSDRQTTYTSATQVQMYLLPGDLSAAGTGTITVANGGLVSGAVSLPVINPTVPQITQLTPAFTIAGSNGVELLVDGPAANTPGAFAPTSVINWNGAALPTTYVSAGRLRTFLPMGELATAGTAQVTVTTPAPGGGTSAPSVFLINNPTGPAITSLNPVSATVGSREFTLTVNGQNFVAGRSIVNWNGTPLPTQWQSGTQLTTLIPEAGVAAAGTADVTVVTSGPGGGTSITVAFEIAAPRAPDITSLSPSSVLAGGAGFELFVNGSNFTPQSVVNWNGVALATMYGGGSQLRAVIPAAGVATPGIATVTVSTPGAPASDSLTFVISNANGPVLTRLNPARTYAGGFASSIAASGTFDCNALQGALVNGELRQVTSCSSGAVNVPLARPDIATAGTVNVAIQTTTPAGVQMSIALPLTVVNPPAPVINTVSPSVFRDRQASVAISVSGAHFVRGTVLHWNGTPRNTSVSSESSLSAQISSADLAAAGTATVTVVTPAPGGGTSNALVVQIEDPRVPTITSVQPTMTVVKTGDEARSMTLRGNGFAPNSTVSWNGMVLETSYSSATSVSARIPAAMLRAAGVALVTVTTPAPGGGTSAPWLVEIFENTSTIRITDISPDSAPVGSAETTITVYGAEFKPSSRVEVYCSECGDGGDVPLTTTFVSTNELRAVVPARRFRERGNLYLRVDDSDWRSWRVHDAFYFGEGVTGPFFDTEYAITNVDEDTANVTMTFAKENGSVVRRTYSVPGYATLRVVVDQIAGMEASSFSTLVETRDTTWAGLMVQRDVRWGAPTYGRHSVTGLGTSTEWYFGEGVDAANFDTYLLLGNFGSAAATATITAVRPSGGPVTTTVAVPANSRVTVNLGKSVAGLDNRPFGFSVKSDQPVVAERAVYGTGPRLFEFGSVSAGAARPSNLWVLPEGAAGPTFDSYHTIANFGTDPVDVRVTILADTGQSFTRTLTVPAESRETFAADADPELAGLGGFAAKIEALNGEVVAELAQYAVGAGGYYEAHGGPGLVPEWVDALGMGQFPSYWSGIGYFGGATNDDTYILVANPNSTATTIRTTCTSAAGLPMGFTDTSIGPNARATVRAADACTGLFGAPGAFSFVVYTLDNLGIVVGTASFTTAPGEALFSAGTFTPAVRD
jgi:hypothetical protein